MSQAGEHHSHLAISFDKAANDEAVPLDRRVEFARRANWLRVLARLAAKEPGRYQQTAAALTALAASVPPDGQLSSFKLDLLLRHYDPQPPRDWYARHVVIDLLPVTNIDATGLLTVTNWWDTSNSRHTTECCRAGN